MRALVLAIAVLAGCGTFEDPTIVIDLRVIAMQATPPEQVVDVDLEAPSVSQILAQLQPTTVCALVADPGFDRPLRWSMTLCRIDDDDRERCDSDFPQIDLGSAVIEDPDRSMNRQLACAMIIPDQRLLAILNAAVMDNPVEALGGVQYTVMFTVGAVDDRSTDIYAAKHLRVSPRIPPTRTANANPAIATMDSAITTGGAFSVQDKRCGAYIAENSQPPILRTGQRVTLFPVEMANAREKYVVPTLDGRVAMIEETLTYQWLATAGAWSDEFTGGGHDILGNQSLLGSDWITPGVNGELYVSLWMIQRDERYGVSWFETCILVTR